MGRKIVRDDGFPPRGLSPSRNLTLNWTLKKQLAREALYSSQGQDDDVRRVPPFDVRGLDISVHVDVCHSPKERTKCTVC